MKDPWLKAQYGTETLSLVHAGSSVGLIVNSIPFECYNYSHLEVCSLSDVHLAHLDAVIVPSTSSLVKVLEFRPMFEQMIIMRHRMIVRLGGSLNLPFLYASIKCAGCTFAQAQTRIVDIPKAMMKHKQKLYM